VPKIEPLHQNTPEWHRWRLQGIGSSDAPIIMGDGAFKTPRMLWSIKTGKATESTDSPAARRGREMEQRARRAYEDRVRVQIEPICLVHERLGWMRASLDGLTFDGSIVVEIKCPQSRRSERAASEGRIPPQYYAQLQHQLEVSRAQEAHYWSFSGFTGILVRVQPDREYIDRLVDAETEFWHRVVKASWPDDPQNDLDLSADPEWSSAALKYIQAKNRLDQATLDKLTARQKLESMAIKRRTFGCGVEVLRTFRKGAVNYSIVPELIGVDLEPYRKPRVEVITINIEHDSDFSTR
jgi:putative phage-type endonuclease